jgi:hypothetical protein
MTLLAAREFRVEFFFGEVPCQRRGLEFSIFLSVDGRAYPKLVVSNWFAEQMATAEPEISKLHEVLAFALQREAGLSKAKATLLAAQFASLEEFLEVEVKTLAEIRSVTGRQLLLLNQKQLQGIVEFRATGILDATRSTPENWLVLIARDFVRRQARMLEGITLPRLSPNPFLIKCLNLNTPREVVELNVYMFSTRSIVTSMGFFIQSLLISSSDTATQCDTPWDILKTRTDGQRSWIQVKSGPNDMDADQIRYWSALIADKVGLHEDAYIGTTYGKRGTLTVTLGLFKTYLPDWEKRTLIGRELWDFISEDPTYHERVFPLLAEAASRVLGNDSIEFRIQQCVDRVTEEFCTRYGREADAVERYLADIF